jgi:hypothetical protein
LADLVARGELEVPHAEGHLSLIFNLTVLGRVWLCRSSGVSAGLGTATA